MGDEHEPVAAGDGDRGATTSLTVVQTELDDPLTQLVVQGAEVHGLDDLVVAESSLGQDVALEGDAAEVVSLRGLGGHGLAHVVEAVEDVLDLLRVQGAQVHAAAGGHQEEA